MTESSSRINKQPWGQSLPCSFISHGGFNVVDVLQALQGVLEQVHQAVEHCSSVLGEGGVLAALTCLLCQPRQAGCTRCMTQRCNSDPPEMHHILQPRFLVLLG